MKKKQELKFHARRLLDRGGMMSSNMAFQTASWQPQSFVNTVPMWTHSPLLQEINEKIHSEIGPAIHLDDGSVLYFWHGYHVPEWFVMNPELITLEMIIEEKNAETKQLLIERYGRGRFMAALGGKPISHDQYGLLWLISRQHFLDLHHEKRHPKDHNANPSGAGGASGGDGNSRVRNHDWDIQQTADDLFGTQQKAMFVQVKDGSTDRIYFIQVPTRMHTPREAVAWTFGLREVEYEPEIQT